MTSNNLLDIQSSKNLQKFNTLNIPSAAEYFIEISDEGQLDQCLRYANEKNLSVTILGGGSNVVLPSFLSGLVIKMETKGRKLIEKNDSSVLIEIAAGENWHELVMWAIESGYYGLENLALIPGSVGAAPIQNIGAYGVELESFFYSLKGIDLTTYAIKELSKEDCLFAYRDSIFKHELRDKFLITSVTFQLATEFQPVLTYPALKETLAKKNLLNHQKPLNALSVAETVIGIRQSKLPDPDDVPNAGSFFKNPIVDQDTYIRLLSAHPEIVAYSASGGFYKLAAGWLLDQAGWKGKLLNDIAMHAQQALVLTNPLGCGQEKILNFVNIVQESILEKFGVQLEVEPRIYS
jgi:UDP-N-acetylmuramate dehydrogenase